MESSRQSFIHIAQVATTRGRMGSDQLVIRPPDLFVKRQVRRAPKTAALRVLVENTAEKKGIVADVRSEEKGLLGRGSSQRDQDIGNILAFAFLGHVRRAQAARARERLEQRRDVITQLSVGDADVAQDMARQDIKIKMGRDLELTGIGKDGVDEARIIQNRIACVGIAEEINQRDVIGLRASQNPNDKVEILRREARPTVGLDHRGPIMSISNAAWQAPSFRAKAERSREDEQISGLFEPRPIPYAGFPMKLEPILFGATLCWLLAHTSTFGNGGAWQTGVPVTGNGAASDQKRSTNVTIEEEKLVIDLHQEFAAVEVRYRMRNTGAQVDQAFFFPVERWAESEDEGGNTMTDLEGYAITADSTELKWENVDAKGEKPRPEKDSNWGEFKAATRLWKKSVIPFTPGQTREILIRYRSPYAAIQSSVSDDSHSGDAYFRYSLSPAATWKGPIGKGKVTVNYLHSRPEEISITKPKDRFKKITDTQFEWDFQNLKPTLADDMKIVVHPAYDTYPARAYTGDEQKFRAEYVIEGNRYFLQHSDYDATASSTLKPDGEHQYGVDNIKGLESEKTWAEGVEGDGVGESITLNLHRSLPLDAIMIMPGYRADDATLWSKNNRVAELEITLNGEHTFVAAIPDDKFANLYPIPVRDYAKPVDTVKLVIKKVHAGSSAHDTCISILEMRAKLLQKPKIQPAR